MRCWKKVFITIGLATMFGGLVWGAEPKVWHVTATKDQTFVVDGEKNPVVTVKAGEAVHLKITAEKAQRVASDGSVHSFTIKELASQGWDLKLKQGTQEYTLTAPSKPGEYLVQCMVFCGTAHAGQKMKLVVLP